MAAPRTVDLNFKPRAWQAKAHLARKRFTVLVLHRRAGKSKLAMMELIEAAIKHSKPLGRFGYIAPELKQAKSVQWSDLKHTLREVITGGGCEVSESELTITFKHNGAIIRLYGANDPDALRGLGFDGVVLDEVAQMPPMLWNEIISPTLSDLGRRGWAIFIGTVKGVDLFSEIYFKAKERVAAGDPDWFVGLWTVFDTGAITEEEIKRLQDENENSPMVFAREYLCDFNAQSDDQLISLADATAASMKTYTERDIAGAARIIGVDPARFGNDRSVVIRRQGLVMFPPLVFRGVDNMGLADRIATEINAWKPHAVFIDSGGGAGVIDRLRQLGHSVIEVPFAGKALNIGFSNRRAEMWWGMREWIRAGGAIPVDRTLITELATPVYWRNNRDQVVLESKDEIKKRLPDKGSPDCFVAGTLIRTPDGPVPIETLRAGDVVSTPMGPRTVLRLWESTTEELTTVTFSNGSALCGRGKHKVFTWDRGFVRLDALAKDSQVESDAPLRRLLWRVSSWFTEAKSSGFRAAADTSNPGGRKRLSDFFTGGFGSRLTAPFRKAWRYITEMVTGATTPSRTWSACPAPSTAGSTCLNGSSALTSGSETREPSTPRSEPRSTGTSQKRGLRGTQNMASGPGTIESRSLPSVPCASSSSSPTYRATPGSAHVAAHRPGATHDSGLSPRTAPVAERSSWLTAIGLQRAAPTSAATVTAAPTSVFNLTLDADNVYYANGILVANCADAACLTFAAPVVPPRDYLEERLMPSERAKRRYHPFAQGGRRR